MLLVQICERRDSGFVAGVVFEGERIVACAPILRARLHRSGLPWTRSGMRALVKRTGWIAEVVSDDVKDLERNQ